MLDPKLRYTGDMPFRNDGEYLEALYVLMDLVLFPEEQERMDLYGLSRGQDAESWAAMVRERAEISVLAGIPLHLESLMDTLAAPPFLRMCLVYLLRIALEPEYESKAAGKLGKESLTIADLVKIFGAPVNRTGAAALYASVESVRGSLSLLFPQLTKRDMIAQLTPMMDSRLIAILTGNGEQGSLPCGIKLLEAPDKREQELEMAPMEILAARETSMPPEIVVLWGPEGSGKKTVLRAYAEKNDKRAVLLPLEDSRAGDPEKDYPLYPEAALLIRECFLTGSIPAVSGIEKLPREKALRLLAFFREKALPLFHTVCVLMDTEELPDDLGDVFFLEMPQIKTVDRIRLWAETDAAGALPRESLKALANTFALTPGQIKRAAEQAVRLAGPGAPVTVELLYQICYAILGHPMKHHTQRVRSPFTWDDLKMNPADKVVLKDLCRSVRNRHVVMQEWGFERKVPYGSGITALFSGPPGTGKTMAAQIIANELHMELYKIDLSQLIDKYVGETEKNIRRVFDEAKKSNCVLFFDEADAIFNKRLEAGNSNERFANIESSLLLQCIEEYNGVALLATNNMTAIDAAFLRRFRFYLSFKEPDEEIRREIWSSVFPEGAPVDEEVDFRELARIFSFTGAIIKNVALQAAYLAADRKKNIGLLEIMVAVRRELEKNHRMLTREEMGSFGYLFPEVIAWNKESERS